VAARAKEHPSLRSQQHDHQQQDQARGHDLRQPRTI